MSNLPNSASISRRSFIGAAGALGAAAAVAGASSAASVARAASAADISWDKTADVVVIGLGGAGDAAAVSALEAGVSVIAIECNEQGGGSTRICGGLVYLGGGTPTQQRFGVEDTVEDMKAYLSAALGPSSDPNLLDVFCANNLDLYDWLVEQGVTFEGDAEIEKHVVVAPEGVCLTYSGNERAIPYANIAKPAPRGHTPNGGGAAICDLLEPKVSEDGEVLYNTRATELVCDESGAVVGVLATDADGAQVAVQATKGVVIAAGGFCYNDEMLSNYAPEGLLCNGRVGTPTDLGDGILMGMKIGAATRSMSRMNVSENLYMLGSLPEGVLVNWNGLRIVAEDWYGAWVGREVTQQFVDNTYTIVDATTWAKLQEEGFDGRLTIAAQADTIEELCEAVGLPAANVANTIERYNQLCDEGTDADWGKDSVYLETGVRTAPFYAFNYGPVIPGFHTLGGLRINENAEVLNLDGEPIVGLYAAGRSSCGIYGEYPGSGTSVADCLIFGRIAGAQAAARA